MAAACLDDLLHRQSALFAHLEHKLSMLLCTQMFPRPLQQDSLHKKHNLYSPEMYLQCIMLAVLLLEQYSSSVADKNIDEEYQ